MTGLEEKINSIIDGSDFNDLPVDERTRIRKYTREMQIQTLYQVLNLHKDLTNKLWRGKIREWLKACVEIYQREEQT